MLLSTLCTVTNLAEQLYKYKFYWADTKPDLFSVLLKWFQLVDFYSDQNLFAWLCDPVISCFHKIFHISGMN